MSSELGDWMASCSDFLPLSFWYVLSTWLYISSERTLNSCVTRFSSTFRLAPGYDDVVLKRGRCVVCSFRMVTVLINLNSDFITCYCFAAGKTAHIPTYTWEKVNECLSSHTSSINHVTLLFSRCHSSDLGSMATSRTCPLTSYLIAHFLHWGYIRADLLLIV